MNIKNVWNIEFELKSDILREFNFIEINDIMANLKELWKYCTNKFLIKIDRINTRVERCPINIVDNLCAIKNGLIIKQPKTNSGIRTIAISNNLLRY